LRAAGRAPGGGLSPCFSVRSIRRHPVRLDRDIGGARSAEQQVRAIVEIEHAARGACTAAFVDREGDALGLVVARAQRCGVADRRGPGLVHARVLLPIIAARS
jgi:hypothetical protein